MSNWTFLLALLILLKGDAQTQEYAEMQGDVTVAGLFEIQSLSPSGDCGTYIASSVQLLESVKWVFKTLNDAEYIPGVKIGLYAGKTCKRPENPNRFAFDLIQKMGHERHAENKSFVSPILGLIGPEYSYEAQTVSRSLSAMPSEDRLLQIGFSTTAETLGDRASYPNFIRIVHDDSFQAKTIVSLIRKFEWNRVAVIHEDTIYGKDLADKILMLSGSDVICIPYLTHVSSMPPFDQRRMEKIIHDVTHARKQIFGIVFVGTVESAHAVLLTFESEYKLEKMPMFMFAEGLGLRQDALTNINGVFKLARGSVTLGPASDHVSEFYHYWKGLFTNVSALVSESQSNPWLLDVFQVHQKCRPSLNDLTTCVPMTGQEVEAAFPQSMYTEKAIVAAYVMAKTIRESVRANCGSTGSGLCSTFVDGVSRNSLREITDTSTYTFKQGVDFPFVPSALQRYGNLSFDVDGNVVTEAGVSTFQVYNYQSCGEKDDFCFRKVGEFLGGSLTVNINEIKSYDFYGDALAPDAILRHATCPVGSVCSDCQPNMLSDATMYIPGDVILVALLPIYDNKPLDGVVECGDEIRTSFSVEFAEAVRFGVEEINRDPNIFPNKKVGLIVLNTCVSPLVTQEKILNLHKNGVLLPDGTYDSSVIKRILGYVGPWHSSTSIPASNVLQNLQEFMVSTGALHTSLSDRSMYPYFLRLTTPDHKQAEAMMTILKELSVNYIQIIYSKEAYGEGGMAVAKATARNHGICVANTYGIDMENPYLILDELRKHGHARAVIVWALFDITREAIQAVAGDMHDGEFFFLGSESWETERQVIEGRLNTIGSLTLSLEMPLDPKFKTYFANKTTDDFKINPWLQRFLEAHFECYFPMSFDRTGTKECDDVADMLGPSYIHSDWTAYTLNTTLVALTGAYHAFKDMCGPGADLSMCPDYHHSPQQIVRRIMESTAYTDGRMERVFDDNGDGTSGYRIYNIQKDPNDFNRAIYVPIGHWRASGVFEFDRSRLVTPENQPIVSQCPNEILCNLCFNTTDPVPSPVACPSEIALGSLLGAVSIALIINIVCCYLCLRHKEDPYDNVTYLTPIGDGKDRTKELEQNNYTYYTDSPSDSGSSNPVEMCIPNQQSYQSGSNTDVPEGYIDFPTQV